MARSRQVFAPSNRLILFGAGATRGGEFGYVPECLPPLNRDFFTQLQRITKKHGPLVRDVIADVTSLFDANFSLTLEEYFTQLEFLTITAGLAATPKAKPSVAQLRAMRGRLMAALSAVLEASTNRAITAQGRGCSYHHRIVENLAAGDTMISFNYDCILDDALRRGGDGKWSARWGYGFPRSSPVAGFEHWNPDEPASNAQSTIYLLKLHGSVNWRLPSNLGDPIRLKQRLHQQNGTPRFTIIPPEWNKSAREEPIFNLLWRRALRAIRGAEHIAIIGFSFTPTDLHVESLFRLGLAQSKLKTLVIVNPAADDRYRIRKVFARALGRNRAVVRQYDYLADFAGAWPDVFAS